MENNSIANSNQSIREIMKMARESYNTSLNQTASLMEASYKIAPSFLTDAAKWSTEDFDTPRISAIFAEVLPYCASSHIALSSITLRRPAPCAIYFFYSYFSLL